MFDDGGEYLFAHSAGGPLNHPVRTTSHREAQALAFTRAAADSGMGS